MAGDVVFFQAMSQDGFVTDAKGSAGWQAPYFTPELGFHDFIAGVSAVIIARSGYDTIAASGTWPFGAMPGIVPGPGPLTDIAAPVEAVTDTPLALVAAARAKGDGMIWVQGDTALARRLINAGLVDRLDLFIMPVTLGTGTERIDADALRPFNFEAEAHFANGVTKKTYRHV